MLHTIRHEREQWVIIGVAALLALALPAAGLTAVDTGAITWAMFAVPALVLASLLLGFSTPTGALLALCVAMSMERFSFSLFASGSVNLRVDELVAPGVAIGALLRASVRGRLASVLARTPGLLPLTLFILENLVSTLVSHSGDRTRELSLFAVLAVGALCYAGICAIAAELRDVKKLLLPLLIAAAVEAAFGLAALAISAVSGSPDTFGVQVDPITHYIEPYGTMYEANFFGHYLAAIAVLVLGLCVVRRVARGSRRTVVLALLPVLLLTLAGTAASLTRAAWLALAVGAVVALWLASQGGVHARASESPSRASSLRAVALAVVGAAALVVVFSGSLPGAVGDRLNSLLDFQSGSGAGRALTVSLVLNDWKRNPLLGLGNASFNILVPGQTLGGTPWIFSMGLAILHDSGVIGMALFVWFLYAVFRQALRTLRISSSPAFQAAAVGG
ncbi:MAG: O-antigen ligase family protein, partial [Ktedonobacterales bacterium]